MPYFEIEDLSGWDKRPHVLSIPGREEVMRKCAKDLAVEQSNKNQECYTVREVSDGEAKIIALALRGVLYEPANQAIQEDDKSLRQRLLDIVNSGDAPAIGNLRPSLNLVDDYYMRIYNEITAEATK